MHGFPGRAAVLLSLAGLLGVAGRVPPCAPDSADFCALERAEDLVFVPGTNWFAVSSAAPQSPLTFIDASSRQRVPLAPPFATTAATGAPDYPGLPTQFHAGGNDLRRVQGRLRLAVLNRTPAGMTTTPSTPDRIELFALAADGTVYGSHQFDRPASPDAAAATRQKWLAGQPTGFAVQLTRAAGWARVPGTEVSFANGVAVSRDDRLLAVAGTYSAAVLLVDRRRGTVRRVDLPHTPDNVTALVDGSFLSVGHTGVPVTGVDPCGPRIRCPAASRSRSPPLMARGSTSARSTASGSLWSTRLPTRRALCIVLATIV